MSDEPGAVPSGWVGLRRLPKESDQRAVLVSLIVCMACSGAIALTVSLVRPYKEANRARDRLARIDRIIGSAPGLEGVLDTTGDVQVEARIVDLESGRYVADGDPDSFDSQAAARDPKHGMAIPREADVAGLGRRARLARVYIVSERDRLRLLVLPVEGAGYVSTMRGYLALEPDLRTIRSLSFYEHAETPGLGSEIDNPDWQALWSGKRAFDEAGEVQIAVDRGRVDPADPDAAYRVDGISGATRTGIGVTNLLRFWLGPFGFGPYLSGLAETSDPAELEDSP